MYKDAQNKATPVLLNLWDTAGQEDYSSLRPLSYPMTDVFVVCYSIISRASFANVESSWLPEIRHYMPHTPIVLVGTKTDLRGNDELEARLAQRKETMISAEEGRALMERQQLEAFCEISALTQKGLPEAMQTAIGCALNPTKKKNYGGKGQRRNAACALL